MIAFSCLLAFIFCGNVDQSELACRLKSFFGRLSSAEVKVTRLTFDTYVL